MGFATTDPFSLVIDLIWDLLEAKDTFTDAVKEQNRIKFCDTDNPVKDSLTESSVPEVMIFPASQSPWRNRNAGGCGLNKTFSILISSGAFEVEYINTVQWAITRAMYDFETLAAALEYESEKFVKDVTVLDTTFTLADDEANRSLKGWSAVWSVSLFLYFSNDVLRGG